MGERSCAPARTAQARATLQRGAAARAAPAPARRARRRRRPAGLACLAAACTAIAAAQAEPSDLSREAAFLLNFAKLVQWPEATAPGPDAPFVIGVSGPHDVAQSIRAELAGASIDAHPLLVRHVSGAGDVEGCQIVFLGSDQAEDEILAAASAHAVLSVGEREGFAARGGVINLYNQDDTLRFEINSAAAQRAGLKLSSHLLRLARRIEEP